MLNILHQSYYEEHFQVSYDGIMQVLRCIVYSWMIPFSMLDSYRTAYILEPTVAHAVTKKQYAM